MAATGAMQRRHSPDGGLVASSESDRDVLHRAIRPAFYLRIRWQSKLPEIFWHFWLFLSILIVPTAIAKDNVMVNKGPTLVMDTHKGNRGDGNGGGGPALATDARRNDNGNGGVRGGPAPVLDTLYRTDMAAGAAADDAECCHKREA